MGQGATEQITNGAYDRIIITFLVLSGSDLKECPEGQAQWKTNCTKSCEQS